MISPYLKALFIIPHILPLIQFIFRRLQHRPLILSAEATSLTLQWVIHVPFSSRCTVNFISIGTLTVGNFIGVMVLSCYVLLCLRRRSCVSRLRLEQRASKGQFLLLIRKLQTRFKITAESFERPPLLTSFIKWESRYSSGITKCVTQFHNTLQTGEFV